MSNVKATPEELRRFAQNLRVMSGILNENFTVLKRHGEHINETWGDSVNRQFMEVFGKQCKDIFLIAESMDEYSRFIDKKTELLEQYLRKGSL